MFNYGSIKKKEKQLWSYGNKEIGFQIGPPTKTTNQPTCSGLMTCLVVSLSGGCNMMESNWFEPLREGWCFCGIKPYFCPKNATVLFQPETELIYPQKEWLFLPNKIVLNEDIPK